MGSQDTVSVLHGYGPTDVADIIEDGYLRNPDYRSESEQRLRSEGADCLENRNSDLDYLQSTVLDGGFITDGFGGDIHDAGIWAAENLDSISDYISAEGGYFELEVPVKEFFHDAGVGIIPGEVSLDNAVELNITDNQDEDELQARALESGYDFDVSSFDYEDLL